MAEPFLGEIRIVSFNFPPKGWAFCSGQLLPINQNQALFALLGTQYGGDGRVTFALPDLRDRVPMHFGDGGTAGTASIGQSGGTESVALLPGQVPSHSHGAKASGNQATSNSPAGNVLAQKPTGAGAQVFTTTPNTTLSSLTLGPGPGGGQPHTNLQPYLSLSFVIALVGIFPSRN
jgi:microcystin-dependent protein